MAEPTISGQFTEFQSAIGFFLGWGRGPVYGEPAWTAKKQQTIADLMKSGYHQFLYPPAVEGEAASYRWSFLYPLVSVTLANGINTLTMPDNYAGAEGRITVVASGATASPWKLDWVNDGVIRSRYQLTPSIQGPPMLVAELPLAATTLTTGQRFQLLFFPIPDQDYPLQLRHRINVDVMTSTLPFPIGGAEHTETLRASFIAAAELYLNNQRGPRWDYFMERLRASIIADRTRKPQAQGYMRDLSDERDVYLPPQPHYQIAATYNGQPFD